MVWTNSDNLEIMFGSEQAKPGRVGTLSNGGAFKVIVADIDATELEAFGTITNLSVVDSAPIMAGMTLAKAELVVHEAFTSGGDATLDLGMERYDGTEIDDNGIDSAIAVGSLTVGAVIACDGALIAAAPMAHDAILTATAGTANFTAGKARLFLYFLPNMA